jgi:predicted RecB family endonuclease
MSGERRWLSSERVAVRVLEELGYRVLELHKRVRIEGVDVAEIDAIALGPDGERYAVEVKAGRLDVTGVRQAYANAVLVGAKPLVVCKGFADESARVLAEKLGVKVIQLSDVFLVDAEELEDLVRTATYEALVDALRIVLDPTLRVKPRYLDVLKVIAEQPTIVDAAKKLGLDVKQLASLISEMRREGLIPRWARTWSAIRGIALLLAARARLQAVLDTLSENLEKLRSLLEKLGA